MSIDHWLAAVGALAVTFGMLSRRLRELPVSGPLLALAMGVVLGPEVLAFLDVDERLEVTLLHDAARISVALAVMAVALKHTLRELREQATSLALLIGIGLPAMAAVCGALAAAILGLPAAAALLLGTTLAPTDPVLSANIITGHRAEEQVPDRVRMLVATEAAANDGLASPFVLVAAGVVAGSVAAEAGGAVIELVVGALVGVVIGLLAGQLLKVAAQHRDIEHAAFLVITVALTLAVLGVAELVGGQEIVAVFVAGLAYDTRISADERREEWQIQEAVHEYLVLPFFVLLGVVLPWSRWSDVGWELPLFAVAVLLLRRLPVLLALSPLLRLRRPEAAFMGWFGPIGAAAVLYLAEVHHEGHLGSAAFAAGLLVVAASTLVHGVTATAGSRLLADRV